MATMDRDTFIPLGTSIAKLLLIASGQGALATAVGEGAGLLAKFRKTLEIGGNRAVFAEKIADDAAKQLLREHQGISEADWHVAARQAASLIDQLSEKERLAAGYNWEELRRTLLDLGGTDLRSDLADESARQAFDWVLEVACQGLADCFTEKEALASILESVEELRAGIQRLADRPAGASQTRAVVADHLEVVRDLAPDPLEDREREIAELTAFVHGVPDAWYAMEAGMISGKTALMSSFALNPPSDMHIVSFFIRRMGGDGNDWRSFSFVAGAQLAEILGDEYTERASEPASQNTEFRQLLRRAATACQSDKNPRPLVLVIDGVDEDSYYERPDDAAAKSILSLLPRHLPKGVKLVTASRLNPRIPEDIVCNTSRVIASLKPSPIAQEKINQKDIETFFKSDLAVDIGAFLAACGGSLTVDELRQLIARRRHLDNVPSREVKACVDHSPGRMLMRVNVGFSDREIPSYTLGHDAVSRAVLRELTPDFFGENDGVEDSAWWAQIRDEALSPYREVVLKWVVDRAAEGWGMATPNYMFGDACFNLMLNHDMLVMLDPSRYKEAQRRFGRKSQVLRMVDLDCFKALDTNRGELPVNAMMSIFNVAELRGEIAGGVIYFPGMFGLYVSHLGAAPDVMLEMVLSIDEPNNRLDALGEMTKAAIESGRGCIFLPYLHVVLESLTSCRHLRDKIMCLLVDIFASLGCVVSGSEADGCESIDLEGWINEILVSTRMEEDLVWLRSFVKGVNDLSKGAYVLEVFLFAKEIAERIEDSRLRAQALAGVADALVRVGEADRARRIAENAVNVAARIKDSRLRVWVLPGVAGVLVRVGLFDEALAMAERIKDPRERARVLTELAGVLVRVGEADRARRVAENAVSVAVRMAPWERARVVTELAGVLVQVGLFDEALAMAEQIEQPRECARVLAELAGVLVQVGLFDEALAMAEQIEQPRERARVLTELAGVLVRMGLFDEALAMAEQIEDPRECARVLAELADALAQAGEADRARLIAGNAVSTAKQIRHVGVRALALPGVAGVLVRVGEADRARRVAENAMSVAERIEDFRLRARVVTGVAGVLVRAGLTDEALAMAERIEAPWERARVVTELAGVLVRAGLTDEALAMAERIKAPRERARVLTELADALAQAGEADRARRVAGKAVSTAKQIRHVGFRAWALTELADALAQAGEADRARRVAENAMSVAARIEDFRLRAQALAELAGVLARAGLTDEALAMAERIKDPHERAQALTELADVLAQAGEADRARRVAENAVSVAERIKDPWERARALMELAGVLARAGLVDEALAMAERIEAPWERARVLTELADVLVQAGAIDEALKIVSVMNDPTSRSRALSPVIMALVRQGSSDDAVEAMRAELAWVRGVAERQDAAGCCTTLAEACADASDLVDSESTMRGQWLGVARSALARSWLYGASVWDRFGILMRVAPDLAMRVVDERILADPEHGTAPEPDPDLGPEGPGGDAVSYR